MFGFRKAERAESQKLKERQRELRTLLLTKHEKNRMSDKAKTAIEYCEYCISEYEEWFEINERKWFRWQKVAIISGVIATLVATITVPAEWTKSYPELDYFGWIRGIPAAIATVATAFLSSFMYREDAVRHELTVNALWNELAKFVCHAKPYDTTKDDEDTSAFTNEICRLVETEVTSWGALVRGSRDSDNHPENANNADG
ncbi:hypothetical protein ACVWZM_003012 [Bradyrhizobium sp. USDA 4501]